LVLFICLVVPKDKIKYSDEVLNSQENDEEDVQSLLIIFIEVNSTKAILSQPVSPISIEEPHEGNRTNHERKSPYKSNDYDLIHDIFFLSIGHIFF